MRTHCALQVLDLLVADLELGEAELGAGGPAEGLYSRGIHATAVPTGEGKPHPFVVLWHEERRHYAQVASMAAKAGVEERRVQLEQSHAEMMAPLIRTVLCSTELGLEPERQLIHDAKRLTELDRLRPTSRSCWCRKVFKARYPLAMCLRYRSRGGFSRR